jgi:hypothetical protein
LIVKHRKLHGPSTWREWQAARRRMIASML